MNSGSSVECLRSIVGSRGPAPTPVIDRIMRRVVESPEGCWLYQGRCGPAGYGYVTLNKDEGSCRTALTHRVAYEHFVGPIPDGLSLDHLCRVRNCCNPWHLDPVDTKTNNRRGEAPRIVLNRMDRCVEGHGLTTDNSYVDPSTGFRRCRTCRDAKRRLYRLKTGN